MQNQDISQEENDQNSISHSVLLPTLTPFESRKDLDDTVKWYAIDNGFFITIARSNKTTVYYGCDLGGCYRNTWQLEDSERQRKSSSRLNDCPFRWVGRLRLTGWILCSTDSTHNHDLETDLRGHPGARQLSSLHLQQIDQMAKGNCPPREIATILRQLSLEGQCTPIISKDISNYKASKRRAYLAGRTLVQALLDELQTAGLWYFSFKKDSSDHLSHLFLCHRDSRQMLQLYHEVIVIDCTYKTNKYGMPLLHFVGMTPLNQTFTVALVFLTGEKESDYLWALSTFKSLCLNQEDQAIHIVTDRELALINIIPIVFPNAVHLLCIWHINKNIVAKLKPNFAIGTATTGPITTGKDWDHFNKSWTAIVYATSPAKFNALWLQLKERYAEKGLAYIEKVWMPWKEIFAVAWTSNYLHLGQTSSSRVEGAHSFLKKYVHTSTGDIQRVVGQLQLAIEHQVDAIHTAEASDRLKNVHQYQNALMKNLSRKVSTFALQKIYMELEKSQAVKAKGKQLHQPCQCTLMSTFGIPCAHQLEEKLNTNTPLEVGEIHSFWVWPTTRIIQSTRVNNLEARCNALTKKYQDSTPQQQAFIDQALDKLIYDNDDDQILLPPQQIRSKGRPSQAVKSTKRDPSAFEYVEGPARKKNRCSACGNFGHKKSTCKNSEL